MSWQPPVRPRWVERLNAHADIVGGATRLVSLDADELLAAAMAQTGLDDFGDDSIDDGWRANYEVFMRAVEQEANLHLLGRTMTRTDILLALQNRLLLVDLWARRPDILQADVEAPLVIVGAARSGTSILHELLTLAPDVAAPTTWKVHHPTAAAVGSAEEVAAARRALDHMVQFWHDIQPEYQSMHRNGGDLPTECIFITLPTFLSDNWAGSHNVPSYSLHVATADHRPAYEWHRRMLQTLSARAPGRRWVLKAPSHLPTLRQLFSIYPDARVVHIHRDPARTMPSMFNLLATLKWMRTDEVDLDPFIRPAVAGIAHYQQRAIDDRASGRLPDEQFHDVLYADLMADPVTATLGIHDHFGIPVPDGFGTTIRDYLTAKPKGSKGRHDYSLATFGLTAADVRQPHAMYLDRFAIPAEE